MQTVFSMFEREIAFVSTDDKYWIYRIRKAMQKQPNVAQVIAQPQKNDGCWYGKIPAEWIKIAPKRVVTQSQRDRGKAMAAKYFKRGEAQQIESEEDIQDEELEDADD